MNHIEQAKHTLARAMRGKRRKAHRSAGRAAAEGLRAAFADARGRGLVLPAGCAVSGYWPRRDEIDVRALLEWLHGAGFVCALPVIERDGRPLLFRRWRPGDALDEGAFGISEPQPDRPVLRPRALLVPLLAVDRAGRRLGMGRGFFDRTLAALRAAGPVTAIGVCFEAQIVRAVPVEPHDEPLDWVVTERAAWRAEG